MTKISEILKKKKITPTQFQKLLLEKSGANYRLCRISKIINGKVPNMTIKTAKIISKSLDVSIIDIID
jgi:hypothetical protein